jgi:hypothetical protein
MSFAQAPETRCLWGMAERVAAFKIRSTHDEG